MLCHLVRKLKQLDQFLYHRCKFKEMPNIPEGEFESLHNASQVIARANNTTMPKLAGYPCHVKYFVQHMPRTFQEFAFQPAIKEAVRKMFDKVRSTFAMRNTTSSDDPITFVGIHNRRTDYKSWLSRRVKGHLLSTEFFKVRTTKVRGPSKWPTTLFFEFVTIPAKCMIVKIAAAAHV